MTEAFVCRGARHSDLDRLAPMLSDAFSRSAIVIFPRGHTEDSVAFRRGELEQWYLQCDTEIGPGNAGTDAGSRRFMVVCRKGQEDEPIGFCHYERVEPGMKHVTWAAEMPEMPPFPQGGDKEQYYLWKDMIYETRRAVVGDRLHASQSRRPRLCTLPPQAHHSFSAAPCSDAPIMVVDSAIRGKSNYARRAISDFCAQRYLSWGDPPLFNDAYELASSLWLRTGFRYLSQPISTPYRFATHEVTDATKEVALRRGQEVPEGDKMKRYRTVPMVRWSLADRDAGDRMAPSSEKREGQRARL